MNLLTPRTAWTGPSRCDVCGHVQADFEPMIAIQRTYMTYCGDCYDQYLFERHWWPISRADAVRILKTANLHYLVEQIPASGTFYRSLRRTPWSEWMNLSVALKDDTHIGCERLSPDKSYAWPRRSSPRGYAV